MGSGAGGVSTMGSRAGAESKMESGACGVSMMVGGGNGSDGGRREAMSDLRCLRMTGPHRIPSSDCLGRRH